jgi:hypothetical protein
MSGTFYVGASHSSILKGAGVVGRATVVGVVALSYFEIVFSVLTGFSVNFTLEKQAVGIYKDMH